MLRHRRINGKAARIEILSPPRRQYPAANGVLYSLSYGGCLRRDGLERQVAAVAAAVALPERDEDDGEEQVEDAGDEGGEEDGGDEGGGGAHFGGFGGGGRGCGCGVGDVWCAVVERAH